MQPGKSFPLSGKKNLNVLKWVRIVFPVVIFDSIV